MLQLYHLYMHLLVRTSLVFSPEKEFVRKLSLVSHKQQWITRLSLLGVGDYPSEKTIAASVKPLCKLYWQKVYVTSVAELKCFIFKNYHEQAEKLPS